MKNYIEFSDKEIEEMNKEHKELQEKIEKLNDENKHFNFLIGEDLRESINLILERENAGEIKESEIESLYKDIYDFGTIEDATTKYIKEENRPDKDELELELQLRYEYKIKKIFYEKVLEVFLRDYIKRYIKDGRRYK